MDSYSREPFKNGDAIPMSINLLRSPYASDEMIVKCSYNGVTVLKSANSEDIKAGTWIPGRFRSRFSGSRSHEITLQGKLRVKPKEQKLPLSLSKKPKPGPEQPEEEKSTVDRLYKINKKVIRNRVYAYLLGQKKPILHGVVVSFPPCVTDDLAYRALNTWLTTCRQSLHLRDYLWIAERQPDTGTIHYHALIPQYFNIEKANRAMQTILCNLVRKGKLKWHIKAAKRYNGVHLQKDKNTRKITNFARPDKSRALANYITKYITKNDDGYSHFAWHCSRGFSAVFTGVSLTKAEAQYLKIRGLVNRERTFETDQFLFIGWYRTPDFFNQLLRIINYAILNRPPAIDGTIPLFISGENIFANNSLN